MGKTSKIKKIPDSTKILKEKTRVIDKKTLSIERKIECTYIPILYKFTDKLLGEFYYCTPDPVDLLIEHVKLKINIINNLKEKFFKFRKNRSGILNPKEEAVMDELIINTISIPIIIYCALETFINKLIFDSDLVDNFSYEMQRYIPLEIKLFKIVPEVTYDKEYFKRNKFKKTFDKINKIRNNIIHQKSKSNNNHETLVMVDELLETDWDSILKEIELIMKDCSKFKELLSS